MKTSPLPILLCFLSLTIFLPVQFAEAQESEEPEICGEITDNSELTYSYEDCDNPFEAVIESPELITLEDQVLTPGTSIDIGSLTWGKFEIPNNEDYTIQVYRQDGTNYVFQRTLEANTGLAGTYEQSDLNSLEFKYYFLERGLDTNWSAVWRSTPELIGTEEYNTYISEFEFGYAPFAHKFETGSYVLLLTSFTGDDRPVLSWWQKIMHYLLPVAHAQFEVDLRYAIPFDVVVSSDPHPPFPPTCIFYAEPGNIEVGEEATLNWTSQHAVDISLNQGIGDVNYGGSITVSPSATTTYTLTVANDTSTRSCEVTVGVQPSTELTLGDQAAALARTLVNQPDAYLWGGKGWDYDAAEFVSPERILSGYTYYDPISKGKTTGIGVDCSGLITWAFNRSYDALAGFADNFVKYVNADGLSRDPQSDPIAAESLLPGDALFFDWNSDGFMDHVAMYVGESGGYDVVNAASSQLGIEDQNNNEYSKIAGFVTYRRIHQADVETGIFTGSPVDLRVTDPDGHTLHPSTIRTSDEEYLREVPGELYYVEIEQGHDGRPIDRIYSPHFKTGMYQIEVIPEAGASPTSTYSLTIATPEAEYVVVEDELVASIPQSGFLLAVGDDTVEIEAIDPEKLFGELLEKIETTPFAKRLTKKRLHILSTFAHKLYQGGALKLSERLLHRLKTVIEKRSNDMTTPDQAALLTLINQLLTHLQYEK